MDEINQEALRRANSMSVFAGADKTFRLADWRAWEIACRSAGRSIPAEEFKARLASARKGNTTPE